MSFVLQARDLHKRFGETEVLKGIGLDVKAGERIAILGSSGSGKSTLLRCLNLLETPSRGEILLDGKAVGRPGRDGAVRYGETELNRLRMRVGMVFQQFHLFPHRSVLENVMEGPRFVLDRPRAEAQALAERHLARVGLADKAGAYPANLSGGQQQRVAIARALAMDPEILLFDEPTSSLDPELVGEVLEVIRGLSAEGRTMLLVTHELGFAYHFATRVLFLHDGHILEDGPPDIVLKAPREERTQQFLARFTAFRF
ncbi:amino acid ABC transporter ATP-binding protein [Labrys wisconsinensis]|uniref:Polar amino acid transport system ATP-binding protein n=1 Tax=Labrys wisconsinensis TaxID=425677 RepID=A0ABU0JK21_9HYPH|nr:amino acid ABC transporter ATP-binding protein [Labrys wisconsinensis]MDQ0474641.1 polar amino acid transport system ATP-binding protein [Labrys wisconsinensis]